MTELGSAADVASLAAGLGTALHSAGLPVGPDRCERLARAVTVMGAHSLTELRACALATMVSDPGQMSTFDRVFAALFGTPSPFGDQPPPADSAFHPGDQDGGPQPVARDQADPDGWPPGLHIAEAGPASADGDEPLAEAPAMRRVASSAERLRGRDFTQLSAAELQELVTLMRELSLSVPPRRTRRYRSARDGKRPDLRRTLRQARRTGGEAIRFARRAPRVKPRRLIVLCDISGSMEPYARALLMLLYCLNGGQIRAGQNRPEVFSFATRLTRLTPALAAASPDTMLAQAGEAAPDWSGEPGSAPRSRSSMTATAAAAWPGARSSSSSPTAGRPVIPTCSARRWRGYPGSRTGSCGRIPGPSLPGTARRWAAWPPRGRTAMPW